MQILLLGLIIRTKCLLVSLQINISLPSDHSVDPPMGKAHVNCTAALSAFQERPTGQILQCCQSVFMDLSGVALICTSQSFGPASFPTRSLKRLLYYFQVTYIQSEIWPHLHQADLAAFWVVNSPHGSKSPPLSGSHTMQGCKTKSLLNQESCIRKHYSWQFSHVHEVSLMPSLRLPKFPSGSPATTSGAPFLAQGLAVIMQGSMAKHFPLPGVG